MTCVKHNKMRGRRRRGDEHGFPSRKRQKRFDWLDERARAYAYAMAEWPAAALATDSHNMVLFCHGAQRVRIAESVLRALQRDARLVEGARVVYGYLYVVLLRPCADGWAWHAHTIDAVLGGGTRATFEEAEADAERFLCAQRQTET